MASTQNFRSGGRTWSMPRIDTRIGFTQIDTMALAACSVILLTLAVAQAGRINKVARRTVCAANIRGVMQSMFTYAQTNDSCFPAVTAPIKGHYEIAPGNQLRGEGLPAEVLKALYRPSPPPLTPREKKEKPLILAGGKPRTAVHCGSPLACMWILVLQNYVTTKSFICPADQFGTVPSIEYAAVTPKGTLFPSNFGLLGTVHPHMRRAVIPGHGESYSIAYPWQGKNVAPGGPTTMVPMYRWSAIWPRRRISMSVVKSAGNTATPPNPSNIRNTNGRSILAITKVRAKMSATRTIMYRGAPRRMLA